MEIDVAAAASALGVGHSEAEARLLAASRREEIVYRPVQRNATIVVHDATAVVPPDTSTVVAAMHKKLDQMSDYVRADECRQTILRRYLGETGPAPCGKCDICCGDAYPRPWMEVTRDCLPDADRLLDPQLTILAAVDWNAAEIASGRNPYGRSALGQLLAADRFNLGRYHEGAERARRIRRAEASPYWGALALTTNPADKVNQGIDSLMNREEIEVQEHAPTGPQTGVTVYEYLVLTDKGRERLERGLVEN